MSSDWAGTNLTTWGKYVFCEPSYGIQATSKMAYTLKSYDGKKSEGPVEQPDKPDSGSGDITTPGTDEQTDIKPGLLGSLKAGMFPERVMTVSLQSQLWKHLQTAESV